MRWTELEKQETTTFFGAALLLSLSAFAGETNKGTLRLGEKVSVDGTPLSPGNYQVEWNGAGSTIEVTLRKGKEAVATFPAHLSEQAAPNSTDAYGSVSGADGSKALTAIYLGGKRFVIEVEQKEGLRQSASSPSK